MKTLALLGHPISHSVSPVMHNAAASALGLNYQYVAQDISPAEITMHLPLLSEEKGIKCVIVPKKEELGAAAGLGVSTAAVAIVKEGEAKDLIKKIVSQL